jgi:hypothetical protein
LQWGKGKKFKKYPVVIRLNTAKELILKLIDEIPETKAGEVIDFLLYLKNKKEQDLFLETGEEAEIWNLLKTDERIPAEKVNELLQGE